MGRKTLLLAAGLALLVAALSLGGGALAQSSANYNLEWHVIGGGGQPVGSAHYAVHSTAGQGSGSASYLSGEHYAVGGGFWGGAGAGSPWRIYLPLVVRRAP
ncbi:MAG: hypothetical protein JXA93_11500 [Anaerolineae bacterium]|nr:hypothetical protein [Anaerolineae bacterium]